MSCIVSQNLAMQCTFTLLTKICLHNFKVPISISSNFAILQSARKQRKSTRNGQEAGMRRKQPQRPQRLQQPQLQQHPQSQNRGCRFQLTKITMITRTGKALNTTMLLTKGSTATITLGRVTTQRSRQQQQLQQKRCLNQQQRSQQRGLQQHQKHLQEEHNKQQLHHLLQHQQQHMWATTRRLTPTLPGRNRISVVAWWTGDSFSST